MRDLPTPPSVPVLWSCTRSHREGDSIHVGHGVAMSSELAGVLREAELKARTMPIESRTWFGAREAAAIAFGVPRSDVSAVRA